MNSLESSECGGQNESEIIQVFENDRESVIYVQAQIAVVRLFRDDVMAG